VDCLAAQLVRAPATLTWSRLTAFKEWHQMVDFCASCEEYERLGDDTMASVKTKVTLSLAIISVVAYLHNYEIDRRRGCLSWRLDSTKKSDCVRHEGFYLVRPDESDPDACVVYYSAAIKLASWCPLWLENFINEQGVPTAVGWLKREAEKRMRDRRR